MKKVVYNLLSVFVLVLLAFSACKIGLGEAVDTVPPTIEIEYPLAKSQIRDSFVLSGSWEDDLRIQKVEVSLDNLTTKNSYGPYEASWKLNKENDETKGSWSCRVYPVNKDGTTEIPDGNYTATITVYDTYGQTGAVTQTFSIDNTSPILTITSPSTTDDIGTPGVTLASFGKIFNIQGAYSDDSGVSEIEVEFYDENEEKLASTTLKVKGTTIDDTVAAYESDLYTQIYGSTDKDVTKSYYCKIKIFDNARKVPAESDDRGNVSETFYLRSDVEKIFSDSEEETFKEKEAYAILSGQTSLDEVNSYYKDWYNQKDSLKKTRSSFTLNPANNPTFTIAGYSTFKAGTSGELNRVVDDTGIYEFKDKGKLNITVSPGLDGYLIRKETLGISLIQCNDAGLAYTNSDGTYKNQIDIDSDNITVTSQGTSYALEVMLRSTDYEEGKLNTGNYYIVNVNGTDTKGNTITNGANIYAIKFMPSNTSAPSIEIEKLQNENAKSTLKIKEEDISMEGSIEYSPDTLRFYVYIGNPDEVDENGDTTATEIAVSADIDEAASSEGGFIIGKPNTDNQKWKTTFKYTLTKEKIAEVIKENGELPADTEFALYVIGKLVNSGVQGSDSVLVTIDTQGPQFSDDDSFTPAVVIEKDGEPTECVNGTITFKTTVTDNLTMKPKVEYSYDQKPLDAEDKSWKKYSDSASSITLSDFDTTTNFGLTSGTYYLDLRAVDEVGNIGTKRKEVNVDQTTDAPVIDFQNADKEIKASNQLNTENNVFGSVSNNMLNAAISDDDGIDEIIFKYQPGDTVTWEKETEENTKTISVPVNGKTSYNFKQQLPGKEGTYRIKVLVRDKQQDLTGYNSVEVGPFLIAVDNGAPNLSVSTTSGAYQAANSSFNLTGKVDDAKATVKIYGKQTIDKNGVAKYEGLVGTANIAKTADTSTWVWTFPVTTTEVGGTYYVVASDIYGQETASVFSWKIDANAPTFKITEISGEPYVDNTEQKYASKSELYTVRGTVIDFTAKDDKGHEIKGDNDSGLEDNIYYIASKTEPEKNSNGSAYVIGDDWQKAVISKKNEGSSTWVANIDFSDESFDEGGEYTIYFAARDEAQNVSLISANAHSNSLKVMLDSVKPTIKKDDGFGSKTENNKEVESNLTLYVIVTDDYFKVEDGERVKVTGSGINKVQLVLNGVTEDIKPSKEDETYDDITYTKYLFKIPADKLSSSSGSVNTYSFKVSDKAGNSETYGSGEIHSAKPIIQYTNQLENNKKDSDEYYFTNKAFKIPYLVTASGNAIYKITWKENEKNEKELFKRKSEDVKSYGSLEEGEKSISIEKPSSSVKVNGILYAQNIYGLEEEKEIKYIFDLDKPQVNLTSTNVSLNSSTYFDANKVLTIEGRADDNTNTNKELCSGLSEVFYAVAKGHVNSLTEDNKVQDWDSAGSASWKVKLDFTSGTNPEGDYTVLVKAKDNVGNESAITAINLIADYKRPVIGLTNVNDKETSALESYYNKDVLITGSVTETYLKAFAIEVTGPKGFTDSDSNFVTKPETGGVYKEAQTWSYKLPKDIEGAYTIKVTATDQLNNIVSETYTTTIDKTAPAWNKRTSDEGSGKSKVGNEDVSALYSSEGNHPWFNTTNPEIYIEYFEDSSASGSGIKNVYYQFAKAGEEITDSTEINQLKPSKSSDKKYEYLSFYIGDFVVSPQANKVKIWAEDNAGNISGEVTLNIFIDQEKPTLSEIKYSSGEIKSQNLPSTILSNGAADIVLTGKYADDASGVKKINVVSGTSIDKAVDNPDTEDSTWKITIPKDKLTSDSTVYIKVTDKAGNLNDSYKFELQIDKDAPSSKITSPSDGGTLNGTINISGVVEENNTPLSIALWYYTEKDKTVSEVTSVPTSLPESEISGDWKLIKLITSAGDSASSDATHVYGAKASEIFSWKIDSFKVNDLLGDSSKAAFYLLPVAYDEAGNCNINTSSIEKASSSAQGYYSFNIDLDSDRPVVKFSTLDTLTGALIKYSASVSGTVSDDDGIEEFKISSTEITSRDAWKAYKQPAGTLEYSSGSFTYTPEDSGDGQKSIYIYVKDSAGGEFWTGKNSKKLEMPKITYKDSTGSEQVKDNDSVITYISDSSPATVGTPIIASSNNTFAYNGTGVEFAQMGTTNLVGGVNKKYVMLGISAKDTNGIKSVVYKFDDGSAKAPVAPVTIAIKNSGESSVLDSTKSTSGTAYDAENKLFYTCPIDLSEITSGVITLAITITDGSGIECQKQTSITVDNDVPEVEIQNPVQSETQVGSVTLSGTASDSLSTITNVKYLVLDNTYYSAYDTRKKNDGSDVKSVLENSTTDFKELNKGTNAGWKFALDNLPSGKITNGKSDLDSYSYIPHSTVDSTTIYEIPVYVYVEDSLGNVALEFVTMKYNPYGDRPLVELSSTSPEDGDNLSGSIQITGSASDNVSVSAVYLQLDLNNDKKFNDDDITILKTLKDSDGNNIYTEYDSSTSTGNLFDENSLASAEKTPDYTASVKYVDAFADSRIESKDASGNPLHHEFWGIKVNGSSSWNTTINKYKELQMENKNLYEDGKYHVSYRLAAMDNNNKLGTWTQARQFTIDINTPTVPNSGTIESYNSEDVLISSRNYESDMYLTASGIKNNLVLLISDVSGISEVQYVTASSVEGLNKATNNTKVPEENITKLTESDSGYIAGTNTYKVSIPLTDGSTSLTSLAIQVIAYKDSLTETSKYCNYNVNFDDQAPAIDYTAFNGDKVSETADSNTVVNSNNVFTLSGKASDTGSGFARTLFFYFRPENETTKSKNRIYDPLNDTTLIDLTSASSKTFGGKTLYGYEPSSVTINGSEITISNSTESHLYKLGVVYINGSWFTIADVTKDSNDKVTAVTLQSEVPSATSYDVFFPYARVIDNTGTEKGSFNAGNDSDPYSDTTDDGDGMPESVIKSQTNWTYDASIRSNFIPDGNGSFFVFVFDKAGNCSAKEYKAKVQNNAPRLTKLWLGTDLNTDEKFSANEFTTYDILSQTVTEQSSYEMNTADFTGKRFRVLDKLALVAEFVGGNNNSITLAYSDDASEQTSAATKVVNKDNATYYTTVDTSKITAAADTFETSSYTSKTKHQYRYVVPKENIEDCQGSSLAELTKRPVSFTFWDATEDTTQGTDSSYCYLKINDLAIIQQDNFAPTVTIDPFYWKSPEDNSLYENSYLNGHIDLAKSSDDDILDLTTGLFKTTENVLVAGNDANKPKVSGIVSLRGKVYDEHTLNSIWMNFTDFTPSSLVNDEAAETDLINNVTYYCVAKRIYDENEKIYVWKTAVSSADSGNASSDKWVFTVVNENFDEGHSLEWQLDIDTSEVGMGSNKVFRILAKDNAETPNVSSTTASENPVLTENGVYDISLYNVPSYTVDLVPYISEVVDSNGNSLNRSRLGRYPVRAGEEIKVKGFNFGSTSSTVTAKCNTTEITGAEIKDSNTITLTAPDYSGSLNITIAGQTVPNNTNSNVAYNIQKGYLASDTTNYGKTAADQAGSNFWTDDVYLSVWNSGGTFTNASNPISGSVIGLTASSSVYTSAREARTFPAHTLYGIWGSNDNMMYNEVMGPAGANYNTRWYILSQQASGALRSPPSETDSVIINNNVFHTWLDDGWADANTFGDGLQLVRDGETASTSASYIEKTSADKVRHQFKNIKIAGAYSGSKYHVYVTYYDSYTKCLKYGKFLFKNAWDQNRSVETTYRADAAGSYVIDGYDAADNSNITWDAGEYSAIKIDNSGTEPIPVVAYYDKQNKQLKIARGGSAAPVSKRYGGTIGTGADEMPWHYTTVDNPSGSSDFGRYVSMEMDNSGNLHIAAQDVTNGILYYGLFTLSDDSTYKLSGGSWTAVDSTSSVGRWNDIKLENYAGTSMATCKPVITYQDASRLNTTAAVKIAFVDESGSWEAMTSPSVFEAQDSKLSTVITAIDKDNITNRFAIGFNSTELAVDFLRGEAN